MKYLKRENIKFVFIINSIITLSYFIFLLIYGEILFETQDQYLYEKNAEFNYVYITDDKVLKNSYQEFNFKKFSPNEDLSNNMKTINLMYSDSKYDNDTLVNPKDIIKGKIDNIKYNELVITKKIYEKYKLDINSYVYSKNSYDNKIRTYKVVGIVKNIYKITEERHGNLGVILFGYDNDLSENINNRYINFSQSEPSKLIKESNVNLIDFYDYTDLIKKTQRIYIIQFIILFVFLTILLLVKNVILINDLSTYSNYLNNIGAINIKRNMIATRSALSLMSNIVSTFSIIIITVIIKLYIPFIYFRLLIYLEVLNGFLINYKIMISKRKRLVLWRIY